MSKIHVLYVGDDDWTTKYGIPDNIEFEVYESDESELTANRPARKLMDLVILDRDITLSEEKAFTKFTRGYCLFATENVQMLNSATSRYFKARMGQYLYTGDVQYFLAHEVRNYYPNPYGEKFNPAKLAVSDSFTGRVACDGNYNLVLDGEFGEDFSQIAYWRYNIPVFEGQCIDMYLEYEKTGDVEIKLRLFQFYYGSMGEVYNFMGLSCSYPDADDTKKQDDDEKRQFYSADIIYTTNGTLGFDFLFDNLVKKKEDRFLCDFHYVIIDEADSVLLDSAIMPLVISGVPRVQSNLYDVCDFFVTTLVEDIDYIEEDKAVWLTPKGVKFAESFFGISNFYGKENFEINRHVTLSLRAHKLLKNKKDYVVTDKKEVELFDGATGRLMHGVKLRGGQHQAIEAKEKVEISQEYRTVASVTFQNLFMMFDKMAGMSGTLMDAKDELFETYGKHVVRIPTNRPLKRVDRKDRYFKNGHDQFWTAVDDVIRLHETGQPVLVVLNSVTDTDLFSRLLIEKNIPHNVLNASNAFWEAQIIAGAGQLNAVTVATTMAGRGTDIKLGDGVKELGGLAVIGIGRMNNSRSERQARGRAGRQGDPGFSQYYVSLEDDIVGAEDDDKLQRYIDGKKRIGKRKIKRIVNQCQKLSVESEEMNRKKSLQYDQVLQRQRDLIYATRKKLLDGASVEQEKIVEIAKENISDFVNHFDCIQSNKKHGRRRGRKKYNDKNTNTEQYTSILNRYILDNISYKLDAGLTLSDMQSAATVSDYLMLRVYQGLSRQRERIGDEEAYEQFVREATLKAVDDGWVELIDYLEQLKYAVAGRASAQRNVMFEYQNEAFESFLDTEKAVKCNIIRNILLSDVKIGKDGRLHVIYP